jgi:hypothetical protein
MTVKIETFSALTDKEQAEIDEYVEDDGKVAIMEFMYDALEFGLDSKGFVDFDLILKHLKYLVSKGADVNAKWHDANTPLHEAAQWNAEIVKFLVSEGADVNAKNRNGNTPLHESVRNWYNNETFEFLISVGADVHAKNNEGNTPLDYADTVKKTRKAIQDRNIATSGNPLVLAIQEKFGVTLDKVQEYGQHTVPPGVVPIIETKIMGRSHQDRFQS